MNSDKSNKQASTSKRIKGIATAVSYGAALTSAGAMAGPITVVHEIPSVPQDLSSAGPSTSFSGMFDISPLLPSHASAPFDVQSARVQAFGFSEADTSTYIDNSFSYSSTSYTPYYRYVNYYYSYSYCSWWSGRCYSGSGGYSGTQYAGSYSHTYVRDDVRTTITDSVVDDMLLEVSKTDSNGTQQSASDSVSETTSYAVDQNYSTGGYSYYNSTKRDVFRSTTTSIWAGDLMLDMLLDTDSLSDLSLDGLLDFTVSSTIGKFTLTGLSLTAVVDVPDAVAVSEPDGMYLILLGSIIGLRFARKRQLLSQKSLLS